MDGIVHLRSFLFYNGRRRSVARRRSRSIRRSLSLEQSINAESMHPARAFSRTPLPTHFHGFGAVQRIAIRSDPHRGSISSIVGP
jgi:hypothetical protein